MYYKITTKIGDATIGAVIAVELSTSKGKTFYDVKKVLSTPSLVDDLLLSSNDSCDYPYLICEDDAACNDVTELFKVMENFKFEPSDDLLDQVVEILGNAFSKEDLISLNNCFKSFLSYLEGNTVRILMQPAYFDNFKHTKMLVDNINSSGKSDAIYIDGDNKTISMSSPEDEFFIRVPSYDELIGNKLLPRFNSIYDPYKGTYIVDRFEIDQWERENKKKYQPELKTPRYKQFLDSDRFRMLNIPITSLDVTGDPKNNDLELQPNEMRYYNSLKSLMDVAMQRENPDMSVEDCVAAHQYSTVVEEYLNNLVLMGLAQNWSHNGLVALNLEDEITIIEDEDDDENDGEFKENADEGKAEGHRNFSVDLFDDTEGFDGAALLTNIFEDICRQDPYYAIEFAIKINRFGSRKPTRISILNGKYLDLNTMNVTTSSGNLGALEVYEDEEGNNLFPVGVIKFADILTDKQYKIKKHLQMDSITMNIGLICIRKFKDMEDRQLVGLSFIDIIEIYKTPNPSCKIKGLNYANGKFSVTPQFLESIKQIEKTTREFTSLVKGSVDSSVCFETYPEFKKAFFEEDVWNNNYSIISLMDEFYSTRDLYSLIGYSYETKSQLKDLVSTGLAVPYCIRANIFNKVIPLIDQVASLVEKIVISDEYFDDGTLIALTDNVIDQLGFIGSFGSAEDITSKSQELSNFSKEETDKEEDDDELKSSAILNNNLEGYKLYRIILPSNLFNDLSAAYPKLKVAGDISANGVDFKIVGMIAMKGKEDPFILLDMGKHDVNSCSANVSIFDLGVVFSTTIKRIAKDDAIKYQYDSKESAIYYANLINNLIKISFAKIR